MTAGAVTGRSWLQAGWTGQPRPVPIRGEADLHAAVDAVLRLADAGETGEILRLSRADGAEIEVWLDVPARGGWAVSVTEPDGCCWLTGPDPLRDGEPELDFRYYDAWSRIPVSSMVPAHTGRPALLELAATGKRPESLPWRAV